MSPTHDDTVLIEIIAETGSTNADLAGRVVAGEQISDGLWLVADRQVAGRGRQGRVWSDGAGNFMGSTLVHLRGGDPGAHTLSLVAGLVAFGAVEAVAPGLAGLTLKWPNDLLIGSAKLAGILLERSGETVIVGIGANLAQAPDLTERSTTSLAEHGHAIDRDVFASALATCWMQALDRWHGGSWAKLRSDWLARAHPFGTALAVHGADGGLLSGTFAGLDDDGALQLQLGSGTRRTIHAGEVELDPRR